MTSLTSQEMEDEEMSISVSIAHTVSLQLDLESACCVGCCLYAPPLSACTCAHAQSLSNNVRDQLSNHQQNDYRQVLVRKDYSLWVCMPCPFLLLRAHAQ